MTCQCISEINTQLEEHTLDTAIVYGKQELSQRTYTRLERKDTGRAETRSRKPRVFAHKFCPFCGTHYDPAPAEEGGAA
jgi:hypothetical protein